MAARDFHADEFWSAFEDAGMLTKCYFLAPGSGARKSCLVRWKEPDRETLTGQQSKDFEIEYRHADMPNLAEGDPLSIEEIVGCTSDFRVRSHPYVDAENGDDGTYRCALLTRERVRA